MINSIDQISCQIDFDSNIRQNFMQAGNLGGFNFNQPLGFHNTQSSHIVFVVSNDNHNQPMNRFNNNNNKIPKAFPVTTQNYNQKNENMNHTIFLLKKPNDFNIFQKMPKTFTITTNTSSCSINIEMLKDTSSIISTFLEENPGNLQYHINIEDDLDVLTKIKQMYEGETVSFNEDQLLLTQKITKALQLTCFPNFLKPPSLRASSNFGYQFQSNQTTSAKINMTQFGEYLKNTAPKTFSIITKKREYKCNVFGILSSTILSDIIAKDPTITSYSYDIEDEFDEFQSICDFFNFQLVSLSKDNMDSIKEIAEDLQIDCILEDVDNYIDYIEDVSKKIDEQQLIINTVDDLCELLYNIKENSIEKVKEKIFESKWSKTKDNVHELAAFILQVIKADFLLHPYLFDLLIQIDKDSKENEELKNLLPFIISILICSAFDNIQDSNPKTTNNFSPNRSIPFNNDMAKYAFIFKLYKNGMISKEEIKSYMAKYNFTCIELNLWFLPELIEVHGLETIQNHFQSIPNYSFKFINDKNEQKRDNYISFVLSYLPDKIELYKEMRDKEEPVDLLTKSLRIDDIDTLQSIISKSKINLSQSIVPFNLFENFIDNGNTRYIDYAAAYGSLKCFKYLLLNHFDIDDSTFACAVFGGNIEIIKIVQQNNDSIQSEFNTTMKTFSTNANNNINLYNDILIPSIIKHRNDLFDWLFMQTITNLNQNLLVDYLNFSIENGNAHSITELIEKANIPNIQTILSNNYLCAAKNGFYLVTQLILTMINDQPESPINDSNWTVFFSNISILNIFVKKMNKSQLDSALIFAIKKEYFNIIDYFFDSIIREITPTFALKILTESIHQNIKVFNYLCDKIKISNPSFFKNINYLYQLLLKVCENTNNIEVAKILTELIINIDSNSYFTNQFLLSIINGSTEICKYFIEKNVLIKYDELFGPLYETPKNIDEDLLILIISELNQENLELYKNYLDVAIQKKYKKLVGFLLHKGAFSDKALKLAVQSNDLDIVDIVLKYNDQPFFINKRFENGTALTIAVSNNNMEIYKRLISLEGIDPCLFGCHNINPLIQSIEKGNVEIFDSLIDLFGEKIKNQKWMLYEVIGKIVDSENDEKNQTQKSTNNKNSIENSIPFEKIEYIIGRILQLKCIDINYHFSCHTLLTYACMNNCLNLVTNILKNDDADVNLNESKKGDTPLMIAIRQNNFDIVELLIKEPNINVNIQNFEQETALTIATTNKLHKIIDLIINHKKFDPIESQANYSFILSYGEISRKFLSIKSLDVNYLLFSKDKEISFQTPLLISIGLNDIEKVKSITSHPSFNGIKSRIEAGLKEAFEGDKKEIIAELIKALGKEINDIKIENKSIIDMILNNEEAISEILKNPNFVPEENEILNAFIKSLTLVSNKSPINIMNLLYKYDKDHHNSIDFNNLLPNGKSFYTSLFDSNIYNDDICHFFLTHGVDPNKPDMNGVYPLEAAINFEYSGAAFELINSGKIDFNQKIKIKNIDSEKPKYTTYIHMAAASSNYEVVEFLLEKKKFDINVLNDVGDTPLIVACKMKRKENVIILFEYDFVYNSQIDFHHKNNDGNDALKIVNSSENAKGEIIEDKDDFLNTLLDHLN